VLGSMTTFDDHVVFSGSLLYAVVFSCYDELTVGARPLKLRGSPKAPPTTLLPERDFGDRG
jgi:hypothetical protein